MIICVQTGKHFNQQLPQRVNSTLRLRKKKWQSSCGDFNQSEGKVAVNDIEPSRQYCVLNQLVPFFIYLFFITMTWTAEGRRRKKLHCVSGREFPHKNGPPVLSPHPSRHAKLHQTSRRHLPPCSSNTRYRHIFILFFFSLPSSG